MMVAIIGNMTISNNFSEVSAIVFSWIDYTLFAVMLGLSALIGIYFGCIKTKQNTTEEYLLGGKKMKTIPIAMSLAASHVSGVTLLALPADIYKFGSTYIWFFVSILSTCIITSYVFLPVFYKLQLTSTFEYLKLRFDYKIRTLASFLFTLGIFLHLPIVVYIPALAYAQATGFNVHYVVPVVCGICIFYTTIGGLKAVVWTDSLQFVITLGAISTVFYLGISSAGGIGAIYRKSLEGHRLDILDFNLDPTKRDSFWVFTIGQTVNFISTVGVNQGFVQRFLALPRLSSAKKSVIIFGITYTMVKIINVSSGLIMYTKYADCDPLTTKVVKRNDQLLPYYVMDVAGHIPGLPGLFIAGVFSAALSTLSSHINTVAGSVYKDFINPFMPKDTTENTASNILKFLVVFIGIVCTALVYVVENLGGILPLAVSFGGVTHGPLLALFTLGMLFPSTTPKGALYGGLSGLITMSWIVFGSQYYKSQNMLGFTPKPISVSGCDFPLNNTAIPTNIPNANNSDIFYLFRISFYYYALMGFVITIVVGLLVSWLSKEDLPPVHRDLISPVIYCFLAEETPEVKKLSNAQEYYSVDKARELTVINSNNDKDVELC